MADKPTKPKVVSPIYHPLNQASRLRSRRWLNIGIVLLVVAAAIAGGLLVKDHKNKNQSSAAHGVRLIYTDSVKGRLSLADNAGDILARAPAPVKVYATYEALSPDGGALVSFGSPGPQESFAMVGGSQSITADSQKALRTADYQGGSHNMVFINDNTVLYTVCSPSATCKIVALNLSRGKTFQVADTGLKAQAPSSFCYLVGKSDDGASVYLRVSGQNSLGKSASAVYQVNSSHGNVVRTIQVPVYAGFDLSLSPDAGALAFSGAKAEKGGKAHAVIYVLNTESGSQISVGWPQAAAGSIGGKLEWSPDGHKLLMRTIALRGPAGSKQAPQPIYLAYLDISSAQITDLQTINDTRLNELLSSGWLDNSRIVYDQLASAKSGDFTSAQSTVYKQDISSKTSAPFGGTAGQLLGVAF
ncbi:MAG TPA: hypothetical protein VFJ84_00660 [Candidatus Saccharimonadales bacterium]|nr:hypothetical protein [Candidatus Saccharimonadales bacterium]